MKILKSFVQTLGEALVVGLFAASVALCVVCVPLLPTFAKFYTEGHWVEDEFVCSDILGVFLVFIASSAYQVGLYYLVYLMLTS